MTEGSLDSQIAEMRFLLSRVPDLPTVWIRLAEALEEAGAGSESADAWRMARFLVPNSPQILESMTRLGITHEGVSPVSDEHIGSVEPVTLDDSQMSGSEDQKSEGLDLDALIVELQSGRPGTPLQSEPDAAEPAESTEQQEFATETLAEIYESQNHLEDAIRVYEMLLLRPDEAHRAEVFRQRIDELRHRLT